MNTNSKIKVLVIDDDDNLKSALIAVVNTAGFEGIGASDGEEGFKKAIETHPDIIMLDIMMPKLNGWQVLDKLRSDEWGKKVKIIMLTSLDQIEDISRAMTKKVFTYIVKSDLKLDDISNIINNTLKNKSLD